MNLVRIWKFGDQIDTDVLAPGRYMKGTIDELAAHCLEAVRAEFAAQVKPGDLVVGGVGFGIGSSREQAAQALKHLGVGAVIATGAARIFYRNAINLGLPVLVSADAAKLADGAMVQLDLASGSVNDADGNLLAQCEPLPDFLLEVVRDGGLIPNLKKRLAANRTAT
ncbi:MAG: 3-isopropylmalate dehydratase [Rhodocyclaceae bacterium]|nr:3-isopropylmalate dehydratase [Rhodocyclaceae bacterium]